MARNRKRASGGKATKQQKATAQTTDAPINVDQRQSRKQTSKLQTQGSAAAQKRSNKSAIRPQNDEYDHPDTFSNDDDDSNDKEDVDNDLEHPSDAGSEGEDSSKGDTDPFSQFNLQTFQDYASSATLAQLKDKVARLEEKLERLASVEEPHDLELNERKRRRVNDALRLCKARCDEMESLEPANEQKEEEATGEPHKEISENQPSEQELSEEKPTAKAPSGPAKPARTKRASKRGDVSPAWDHEPEKWWPIDRIIREDGKGKRYLVHWQGTDKHGNAWDDSWEPEENVNLEAIREWEDQKTEKARLKKEQATKKAQKEAKAKGKTSGRSVEDDNGDESEGDPDEEEDADE